MENLVKIISESKGKEALLLAHKNADPDSICSALALYIELKKVGIKTRIGAIESLSSISKKIVEKTKTKVEIDPTLDSDIIILLDMSSSGQLGYFFKEIEKSSAYKLIIDHHTVKENNLKANFSYIDENASSTVELVYELLKKLKISVSKETAFAILFGMVAETAHLRYAKLRNFKIIAELLEKHKIQFSDVLNFLETPMDVSEKIARLKAFKRLEIHRVSDFLIAISEIGSFEASVARSLISVGADFSLVVSKKKDEIRVSLRSSSSFYNETKVDLGKDVAPKIAKIIGGTGSGHSTAAGANGPLIRNSDKVKEFVVNFIKNKIKKHDLPRK